LIIGIRAPGPWALVDHITNTTKQIKTPTTNRNLSNREHADSMSASPHPKLVQVQTIFPSKMPYSGVRNRKQVIAICSNSKIGNRFHTNFGI
jgi:hypothetical protein